MLLLKKKRFKYTILSKGYKKKVSFTRFIRDCSERAIHWSIVLARIDLVSLYFRFLWYHSILRGSIDQKYAKTIEIWRQNSEIHSAFAYSRWPPWFPDLSRPYSACVKRGSGNICSVSVFYILVGSQISPRRAKEDSNIPSPGRTRSDKCPTPGPTKTIKSPPYALPTLSPAAWHW